MVRPRTYPLLITLLIGPPLAMPEQELTVPGVLRVLVLTVLPCERRRRRWLQPGSARTTALMSISQPQHTLLSKH